MTAEKIRKLNLQGFRGARFELPIDFGQTCKSMAIYGENAGGKSTITDAIEWFLRGRVDHLWRDDCKEEALRNVLIEAGDVSKVELTFSSTALKAAKTLNAALKGSFDNKTSEFVAFLKIASGEPAILRHAQITNFISKSKAEKKSEIADIVGFDVIVEFRDVLLSTLNALRKDAGYTAAKQVADDSQAQLMRLCGEMITTRAAFQQVANTLLAPFKLGIQVVDAGSLAEATEQLQKRLSNPDRAKQILLLDQIKAACGGIGERVSRLPGGFEASFREYNELVRDRGAVSQLNIEQFLTKGRDILRERHFDEQKCPFCLSDFDLDALQNAVQARISAIEAMRVSHENAVRLRDRFLSALDTLQSECAALTQDCKKIDALGALENAAAAFLVTMGSWAATTKTKFNHFEQVDFSDEIEVAREALRAAAATATEIIDGILKSLEISAEEQKIVGTLEKLTGLRTYYGQYKKNTAIAQAFEGQIETINLLFESFKPVQNATLQAVLDSISGDVGQYYRRIHPDEEVDEVRLVVLGDEGVEFQYKFHGKDTHPPLKYLSESHLNSLGICLFLASAKLFSKETRFFILDDVVTSFDLGHRRRLLRLLKEEFAEWQIVLLTHERVWFDIIKREMRQTGWLFREVQFDHHNGIQFSSSPNDLKELIAEKRKKFDVSNDLRKLCEATLKDICFAIGARVQFRFNDENEARMSGELLNDLLATVNRKCPSLKGNPAFANLEGSNVIINVGSHDNPMKEISGGDIDVALADIQAVENLFRCPSCSRYVDESTPVPGAAKISCGCGGMHLDWKS